MAFFNSTYFCLFLFISVLHYKVQPTADTRPAKTAGISAVFIFASLARPPPHFGLISKIFKSEVEKNGLQQSKRGKEVEVMERI